MIEEDAQGRAIAEPSREYSERLSKQMERDAEERAHYATRERYNKAYKASNCVFYKAEFVQGQAAAGVLQLGAMIGYGKVKFTNLETFESFEYAYLTDSVEMLVLITKAGLELETGELYAELTKEHSPQMVFDSFSGKATDVSINIGMFGVSYIKSEKWSGSSVSVGKSLGLPIPNVSLTVENTDVPVQFGSLIGSYTASETLSRYEDAYDTVHPDFESKESYISRVKASILETAKATTR